MATTTRTSLGASDPAALELRARTALTAGRLIAREGPDPELRLLALTAFRKSCEAIAEGFDPDPAYDAEPQLMGFVKVIRVLRDGESPQRRARAIRNLDASLALYEVRRQSHRIRYAATQIGMTNSWFQDQVELDALHAGFSDVRRTRPATELVESWFDVACRTFTAEALASSLYSATRATS